MPDQIGTVLRKRWPQRVNSIRLSYDDFLTQAQEHLLDIKTAQRSMQYTRELFTRQVDLWPDQCDYAISSIQTMSEPVQNFCTLLDKAAQLPVFVAPMRYELVLTLHYFDEQIHKLKLLITSFRSICQVSSKQASKQRHEIHNKLESLLQVGEDIVQKSNILFDLARVLSNEE